MSEVDDQAEADLFKQLVREGVITRGWPTPLAMRLRGWVPDVPDTDPMAEEAAAFGRSLNRNAR